MQVYSLDDVGKRTFAAHATKGINYTCLECKKVLRLRGGERKRLHFYHLHPNPSCRQSGKSATHLAIQLHLQELFSPKLLIEKHFHSIERIADTFIEEEKLIFEIQCSPITAEEVRARMEDYGRLKLQVVWVLHDKRFNRFRPSAAEIFLKDKPHYYTDMNERGEGMIYKRGFRFKKPVDLRSENFSFKPVSWREWIRRILRLRVRGAGLS